ncbi:MAG TPA: hypothetical protein VNF73_02845 [Candidatus Saccharimonadales bacterium]|nr:hypothetical protein [Candidatus Saccharimonadales bacterium]
MAQKLIRSDLHVAIKSGFVSGIGRVDIGDVAVDGHPILKRAAGYFRPLVPRFLPPDVELEPPTAPAAPTPPAAPAAASTVPPRSGA